MASRKKGTGLSALLAPLVAALVLVPVALADDDDDDDDGAAACAVGTASGDFARCSSVSRSTSFLCVRQRAAAPRTRQRHGDLHEQQIALTYTANLVCVNVTGNTARFGYVIPPGNFVSGTNIVWQVTDGGPNGQNDLAGWIAAPAVGCDAGFRPAPSPLDR